MDMTYTGKWTFAAAAGTVSADAASGLLTVTADPPAARTRLNAYGNEGCFVLQAAGGDYVTWSDGGYRARRPRTGEPARFALETVGDRVHVVDLGKSDDPFYWDAEAAGRLGRREKSAGPPAPTAFAKDVVTPGLVDVKTGNLPPPPVDLSWICFGTADLSHAGMFAKGDFTGADLSGANLTDLAMPDANLSGANLTGAKLCGTDLTKAALCDANLSNANLTDATLIQVNGKGAHLSRTTLHGADLTNATLAQADLSGADAAHCRTIVLGTDFTDAVMAHADFTGANVSEVNLAGANLTGAKLGNTSAKSVTVDLSKATFSPKTNLTAAVLRYVCLTGRNLTKVTLTRADLTGCDLHGATLTGAELGYTNLSSANLTGGVALFGANLSNAVMTGASLIGTQMGAIDLLFRVADDQGDYRQFSTALGNQDAAGVKDVFQKHRTVLTGSVNVQASGSAPDRVWNVIDSTTVYTVRLATIESRDSLDVYRPETAAVLVNAYMQDVDLSAANMFAVRASGVQLSGKAVLNDKTILESAQFSSANLDGVNFKGAQLQGANFDHASLVSAAFDGAWLTVDATGGQASFANANLQGASFTNAHLDGALFTDAAVAVTSDGDRARVDGVWLFSSKDPAPLSRELDAAARLFRLDASLAGKLVQGPATDAVRAAFNVAGVDLTDGALVIVVLNGSLWTIRDGDVTYRVFHACDKQNLRPALGVHNGPDGLDADFTMPLYLERYLASGPVAEPVQKAFHQYGGGRLGPQAAVTAGAMPTDWSVVDSTATYDLWLGLNADCDLSISARPAFPAVQDLFACHSLPLSRRATVTASGSLPGSGKGRWEVDNDSDNPFNATVNYIRCVLDAGTGEELAVYGRKLRVRQFGPDGSERFHNITVQATALTKQDLSSDTVCPNSNRTQLNDDACIPFREWMRSRELPKPPSCVPSASGDYFCPPSSFQLPLSEQEHRR